MFYLRSLIALHLSDSPTDLIPRPGAQKFKHPSAASAATPFALALPAASSKLLLATAPLSSALFGWHYYNALSFFVKHLFRVFSRTKSSFSKKTDRKKRSVAIFCILPQSAAAAIFGFPRPFVRSRYFKKHPFFCTEHTRFMSVFRLRPVKKPYTKCLTIDFFMYSDCKR